MIDEEKFLWYFTVEYDIPIEANSEEEAEKIYRQKYASRFPRLLGIIRPNFRKLEESEYK